MRVREVTQEEHRQPYSLPDWLADSVDRVFNLLCRSTARNAVGPGTVSIAKAALRNPGVEGLESVWRLGGNAALDDLLMDLALAMVDEPSSAYRCHCRRDGRCPGE